MTALSPIESEFASTEEAEAHDLWLRRKIAASLNDGLPTVPHDEAMAEIERLLTQAEARHRQAGNRSEG